MHLILAKEIINIINLIKDNNYQIYLVGGYVRDSLLNIKTNDIDMTSNATVKELKEILKEYEIDDTYSKYGSIKFNVNEYHFEITTFRKEDDYKNYRSPSLIEFTSSLEEDLIRRDFTINALCYDNNQIIDIFNGLEDLNNKIIRTINDPRVRFKEDALRILRALRFSSYLGFKIDKDTKRAIKENYSLLLNLNFNTLYKELKGIISGKNYLSVLKEYQKELKEVFKLEELKIDYFNDKMNYLEKEALFFYSSKHSIKNIYLDNKIIFNKDKIEMKRLLNKVGKEKIYNILSFRSKWLKENISEFELLKEIINNKECYNLEMLAIKGEDLLNKKIKREKISVYLKLLLDLVIEEKCENNKEELLKELEKIVG